jgi:hypothetical protein
LFIYGQLDTLAGLIVKDGSQQPASLAVSP